VRQPLSHMTQSPKHVPEPPPVPAHADRCGIDAARTQWKLRGRSSRCPRCSGWSTAMRPGPAGRGRDSGPGWRVRPGRDSGAGVPWQGRGIRSGCPACVLSSALRVGGLRRIGVLRKFWRRYTAPFSPQDPDIPLPGRAGDAGSASGVGEASGADCAGHNAARSDDAGAPRLPSAHTTLPNERVFTVGTDPLWNGVGRRGSLVAPDLCLIVTAATVGAAGHR
jgi:hypothetical protein